MTDGHPRRDGVGVHNHVRVDALNRERQVFLTVCHAACSFLSVTTCKLISDLRNLDRSHFDLDHTLLLFIGSDHDLIDVAFLRVLEWR